MTTFLLIVLAVVLAMSMSSKGERTRAFMLGFVVLLLSGTASMQTTHTLLNNLMTSIGNGLS